MKKISYPVKFNHHQVIGEKPFKKMTRIALKFKRITDSRTASRTLNNQN